MIYTKQCRNQTVQTISAAWRQNERSIPLTLVIHTVQSFSKSASSGLQDRWSKKDHGLEEVHKVWKKHPIFGNGTSVLTHFGSGSQASVLPTPVGTQLVLFPAVQPHLITVCRKTSKYRCEDMSWAESWLLKPISITMFMITVIINIVNMPH